MNKNTVYVLQKDLPFAKAGVDFIRENEDADYYNTNFASYHDRLHKSRVENNPEWFKPKEQVNESTSGMSNKTEWWEEEIIKCIKSPYYFATQYLIVNDKPFTTPLNEKQFNSYFGMKQQFYAPKEHVDESKPTEQPQWEILSVLDDFGMTIYCPSKDVLDLVLKYNGERIHSVKRLSDGEVFSVGDVVAWGSLSAKPDISLAETKTGAIQRFGFSVNNKLMAFGNEHTPNSFGLYISMLSKYKAPKEEQVPIKVSHITSHDAINFRDKTVYSHAVWVSQPIPESKYQPIREAIEGVLNGDNGNLVSLLRDCVYATWGCKDFKHTQDMFDKFLSDRKLLKKSI